MVFDRLASSLEDLFNFCGRNFSLKTVLILTDQLIRLEYFPFQACYPLRYQAIELHVDVGRQENRVYVTDLDFTTERLTAQVNASRAWNPHLIGTAHFASINGHLGASKCEILDSCCAKTNALSSTTLLRWFGIPRVYTSLFPPCFSSMAGSKSQESKAKGGAHLGK